MDNALLDSIMLLKTTFSLGKYNNEPIWKVPKSAFSGRIGTLSIESAIADMCQCIMYNTDKREKRIKRIELIMHALNKVNYTLSSDIIVLVEACKLQPIQDDLQLTNEELISKLRNELSKHVDSENSKLYFQTEKWEPPISKQFHGICTKSINGDGDVYDIMTKIAIIAFSRLLTENSDYDVCTSKLLACAQLIFKGGAAIGKFLFQRQPFWNRLSKELQDNIISSFILGGDNDTSIYFPDMANIVKDFGIDKVSQTIVKISKELNTILWNTCNDFNLSEVLTNHSERFIHSMIKFAECDFNISARKAKGFQLFEVESSPNAPTILCLSPFIERKALQVFTTHSKVEFIVGEDKLIRFELVRAKLGFTSTGEDLSVNTYSELLDISLEYPDSAVLFPKKWISIPL